MIQYGRSFQVVAFLFDGQCAWIGGVAGKGKIEGVSWQQTLLNVMTR